VARVTEHPEVSTSTGSPLKAEFKAFGMGDYVVRQGEPRTSLPVVCRGLVIVTTLTEAGDEVAFQACGLGEFVGLTDWLQGKETYSISGRALIESTVAFVKPEDLFDHAQTNREVLTALLEQIGFQTHALEHRLGWQTVLDASGRVVHSLLDLAGQLRVNGEKEVALPIKLTRTIIAEFAGLRRETVSRVLTQLQRKRLIRQHDRHIVIPSLSQLRKALRRAADSS
jgi:CRP-like cAMP-binding protein